MCCLLALVTCKTTKNGVSFTWEGAWEFDQLSGTGSVKLGKPVDLGAYDALLAGVGT